MRSLGIDYGTVRIGLAISDALGMIAQPYCVVTATDGKKAVEQIAEICRKEGVEQIVVGLPRHMSGEESDSSAAARKLGAKIEETTGLPVAFVDERMSSLAAERAMLEADLSRKKRKTKIDAVAASIILQSFLDKQGF